MRIFTILIFSRIEKEVEKSGTHMAKKKTKVKKTVLWKDERLLSITALLISVGTLLVFLYQTNLVRKQQYMSVLPYLEFQNHATFSKDFKLVLKNKGIGPALITSRNIVINGRKYDLDVGMYVEKHLVLEDSVDYVMSNIRKGNLLSEKEGLELIALGPHTSRSGVEKVHGLIYNDSLEFVVEYASVYGERWQVSSKRSAPVKLDH